MDRTQMTLDEYRKSNPLEPKMVIRLGLDLTEELERYRQVQKPHCDIKASNILVSDDGSFHLAEGEEGLHVDQTGDLYALGILMYRLLNRGRMPFMPPAHQKATAEEKKVAMQRCMAGEPFPDPINGGHAAGEVLRRICHIQPDQRYLTAGEMHEALKGVLDIWETTRPEELLESGEEQTEEKTASSTAETDMVIDQDMPTVKEEAEIRTEAVVGGTDERPLKAVKKTTPVRKTSGHGMPGAWLLGVWVTLSALGAAALFVLMRLGLVAGLADWKGYLYCVLQFVLCGLCLCAEPTHPGLAPVLKRGILKLLWVLSSLDALFALLYGLFLRGLMARYGIGLPSFCVPGLLSMIAPVVAGIVFWSWSGSGERAAYYKLRIGSVITVAVGAVVVALAFTGINKSFYSVEVYPYWICALQLLLAFVCIVNARGRIPVKVLCVLTGISDILMFFMNTIAEHFSSLGLPSWIWSGGFSVLTLVLPLLTVLLLLGEGRKKREKKEI